ncbi:hypothetical protein F9B85_03605 [Heliorestis acidaminivorans]|uniref:Uncharacterized protein n=1 Tax=Heliorestis acidaminivorans TaxID=553427 RepID=A0A6I0EYY1_9FIRM|nr:hypothetical protein [Heliorestis acidaminivorans]KAB2953716.1 hypothetical protein F9B85_03605 [Heliorestis acidaminivorans]
MTYRSNFNNPLVLWTAFGGRGTLLPPKPVLQWQKKYYNDFGYSRHQSENRISVHNNGQAQICVYHARTPYMSYFNHSTKRWTVVGVSWWSHGVPEILWAGDGVFLAKITGFGNIIASFNGITWHNAGYCLNAQSEMITGAYDMNRNSGIVGWWFARSPLYYSFDSLTERTEWTLVGADGFSVPVFNSLTAHKDRFVGVVDNRREIATASSASPGTWNKTIEEDDQSIRYALIRSVHNKLFGRRYWSVGFNSHQIQLCVLNDNATEVTETNLSFVGSLDDNRAPNPENIIWMEQWGRYLLFSENRIYLSADGLEWESWEQTGFTTAADHAFRGAIYVPGNGFYITVNGGYVYFASY